MLDFFRALTALRQSSPALMVGAYTAVDTAPDEVYAYTRSGNSERYLVVLNFGGDAHTLDLSHVSPQASVAVATSSNRAGIVDLAALGLAPNEGLLLRL